MFFEYSEDKKYRIYKRRDKVFSIFILASVILFALFFLALELIENWKFAVVSIFLLIVLEVLFVIDRLYFAYYKLQARSEGKEVIEKGGGILFGPSEFKIEKIKQ